MPLVSAEPHRPGLPELPRDGNLVPRDTIPQASPLRPLLSDGSGVPEESFEHVCSRGPDDADPVPQWPRVLRSPRSAPAAAARNAAPQKGCSLDDLPHGGDELEAEKEVPTNQEQQGADAEGDRLLSCQGELLNGEGVGGGVKLRRDCELRLVG